MLGKFVALLLPIAVAPAQGDVIGAAHWSSDGYIEYVVGNAPIFVSAGHGGDLKPPALADRTYGVVTADRNTLELAREFADDLALRFGLRPHLVLCHLHRSKLDVNRDIVEAAQGDAGAEAAYLAFHQFCADARANILGSWGYGIYLDLHGHGHPENWVELGYRLTSNQLALSDAVLAQPSYVAQSTTRSAGSQSGIYFPELLRGATSLGGHLQSGGFDSVPSPVNPNPAGGNYFRGGWNVQHYGSLNGSPVDGVQIEAPFSLRRTTLVRTPFLSRVGGWIETFFVNFRGTNPALGGRVTVEAVDRIASETGGHAEFVIRRTGNVSSSRTLPVHWAGTATPGADYTALPATVFFPAGFAEVRIGIDVSDDAVAEGDETVELWLPTGEDCGVPNRAAVVVHDNEPNDDLALRFDFESSASGFVADASGNGRDGVLRPVGNGPTLIPGRFGNALSLDGVDDRVDINDFPWSSGGEFSLAFWFRTSDVSSSGYRYMVSHGGLDRPHRLGVYFEQSTGVLRTAVIYANDMTALDVLDVTRELRDGQWHHYALTVAADDLAEVYIDGERETAALYLGDAIDPAGDLTLGVRSDLSSGSQVRVDLDELRLWNRAIDSVEVALLQAEPDLEAMVYPGSGEDIRLWTGVDAQPTSGPREDVKYAPNGGLLSAYYRSPDSTLDGGIAALAGELFATGSPSTNPLLPYVHLAQPTFVQGPIILSPVGGFWSLTIPPALTGTSLMLQPVVLHPSAANGLFVIGDGHEIRM